MTAPVESFQALDAVPGIAACFLGRIPGVEVAVEKDEAVSLLRPIHERLIAERGGGSHPLVTAEQIHGAGVAVITGQQSLPVKGADGLVTAARGVTLGIYVADCAPVWIVARDGRAGALLHSGKKGTALGIVPVGIRALCSLGNLVPSDLLLLVGPCIRPPCYETDFAAEIRRQAAEAGVTAIHDDGTCTACHPGRYYSYRREAGRTGRMLATLTLLPS